MICLRFDMLKSFLNKLQNDYLEEKLNIEREINNIQIHIRENIEFIKLLEKTNDASYESFTPREVNVRNKDKISELKEEQQRLEEYLEEQKEKYEKSVQCLNEVNEVIECYKADIMSKKVYISEELKSSIINSLQTVIQKIEFCSKLVEIDPMRCKLELNMISDLLKDIIMDTEKYDQNPV